MASFNIYEAKTSFSQLVDRAAKGEEIVIAKAGKPVVRMVSVKTDRRKRRHFGKNLMGITYVAPDFGAPIWTDKELEELGLA